MARITIRVHNNIKLDTKNIYEIYLNTIMLLLLLKVKEHNINWACLKNRKKWNEKSVLPVIK